MIRSKIGDTTLRLIARGGAINLFGLIVFTIAGFIFQLILARSLDPSDVGLFSLGTTIISLLAIVAVFGLDRSAVWFIAKFSRANDLQGELSVLVNSFLVILWLSSAIVLIVAVGAPFVSAEIFGKPDLTPILRILLLIVPFYAFTRVGVGIFQAYKRIEPTILIEQISVSSLRILGIGFLVWALNARTASLFAYSYTVGSAAGFVLTGLLIYGLWKNKFAGIRPRSIYKEQLSFAWPLLLASVLNRANAFTEIIILGIVSTSSQIGLYSVSWKLAAALMAFVEAFNAIFTPIVAENFANNQIAALEKQFKTVTYWAFSLTLPFGLMMILKARGLLQLFGTEYLAGVGVFRILAFSQIIYVISALSAVVLTMTGSTHANLFSLIVNLVLSIALDFLLIPRFGAYGAGIAGAITIALVNILRVIQVYQKLHIHPFSWKLVKPLLAGMAASIALLAVNGTLINVHYLINLVISGVVILAIYMGVLVLLGRLKQSGKVSI